MFFKIMLNFLGSIGTVDLSGLVDVLVPYSSSTEFVARVKSPPDKVEKVIEGIKKKKILPLKPAWRECLLLLSRVMVRVSR